MGRENYPRTEKSLWVVGWASLPMISARNRLVPRRDLSLHALAIIRIHLELKVYAEGARKPALLPPKRHALEDVHGTTWRKLGHIVALSEPAETVSRFCRAMTSISLRLKSSQGTATRWAVAASGQSSPSG